MALQTVHLTNAWHNSSGGVATFYRALLAAAHAQWRIDLIVPGETSRTERISEFATIHSVEARRAPLSSEYRVLYPSSYLTHSSPIQQILRNVQPDVIETTDKYTLAYIAGLVRIGWIDGLRHRPALIGISCERMDDNLAAYTHLGSASSFFAQAYMRHIYFPQFDHHIAVSKRTALELQIASEGHKRTRGIWIRGMGVDTTTFRAIRRCPEKQVELRRSTQANESTPLLLYAGRLAPEKNLPLLLDTLRELGSGDDTRLLIAGDGPDRDAFLTAAENEFPHRVVYLGFETDRERFADLLANVDVFLHPNPQEPFGIAPLEAMASGRPLVAPNQGGVTEYANAGNAWLVDATGAAFAQAVRQIFADPHARETRVAAALETALARSWSRIARQFELLYSDLKARTQSAAYSGTQEPDFWSKPIGDIDTPL